ncbi:GDSL-type esterase/lipase family protein [uncultured Mucilaginibacter sp.]|uniref:GDSL-type esterase/lipase family protein n=1 Tax=uncultured Mucilaginibacter sp. TaxID=797541 RepID=UPI0025E16160|nr:GDSL-type esterase/lipase family protein [uncultured Mucilaginibacter sp.]
MNLINKLLFACSLAVERIKRNLFPQRRIHLLGDSLMAPQPWYKYPRSGWGEQLYALLNTDKVKVYNKARNGASARTFYEDGYFKKVLSNVKNGDIAVIGFTHNDKGDDATATATFESYLFKFIEQLQHKGARVVLSTPINIYGVNDSHGAFPQAIRRLAASHHLPVIDITNYSHQLRVELDDEQHRELYLIVPAGKFIMFPNGITDPIHLSPYGARVFAKYAANTINSLL